MNQSETFITKFQNLEGVTVAEKRKQLFLLLHSHRHFRDNSNILDAIVPQLKIENHFYRLCFVDLLIYFRRYKELSLEFLKGNDIVVSKISKEHWFFEKLFQENSNDFVDKYLPNLSYGLRLKVLKRLSLVLNEQHSDILFDRLHGRYGVHISKYVLTSCSVEKIEYVLKNFPILLWDGQLRILFKKKKELVPLYIDQRVKLEGNSKFLDCNPIVRYIGTRDPDMFCSLQEKYKFRYGCIGKRSTKRILRTNKDRVIANPEVYAQNLNRSRLVRTLGRDFRQIFVKLFPREVNNIFHHWNLHARLLVLCPKKLQFELFRTTYDQIFYDSLESMWTTTHNNFVLQLIHDPREREEWARKKMEHSKDKTLMEYYSSTSCLNTITPKLQFSTVGQMSECIEVVTKSCLINKSWDVLLSVCELLSKSTRTDDQIVHKKFLELLQRDKVVFRNLGGSHWKHIKEIILKTTGRASVPVIFKYLEFARKNKTLSENDAIVLSKTSWSSSLKDLPSKQLLPFLVAVAPTIVPPDHPLRIVDLQLILAFKGSKLKISDHPRLLEALKAPTRKDELNPSAPARQEGVLLSEALEFVISKKQLEVSDLGDVVWTNLALTSHDFKIWLLRNKPQEVATNSETFLDAVFAEVFHCRFKNSNVPLWPIIKAYSHLKIDEITIQYCLNKLQNSDNINYLEPLSLLLPPSDFAKLVASHKPTTSTVDMTDEVAKNEYLLQRYMLKCFVNVNAPLDVIPVIFEFLSGDYVASCLSPLYSTLSKIPEKDISPFLDKLCKTGAVSVKKHGFYFTAVVQKDSIVLQRLKECHLSQSIAMSYQYFIKNPSDPAWELVKFKLEKLDNNDHFTSMVLVNTPAPYNYKSQYFEVAYEVFRKKQNRFMNVLVDKLDEEVVGKLSNQFFETIKDDFLEMKKSEFLVSSYLIYSTDPGKFELVFNRLKIFKQKSWSQQSQQARDKLKKLIREFANFYMNSKIIDPSLISTFAEEFHKIFTPVEVFEEYIILKVIQFKGQNQNDLSLSVVALYNDLVTNYGKMIVSIFAACLDKIFPKFFPDEICRAKFYCDLLQFAKTPEDELMVIKLLPKEKPKFREIAVGYYKALDVLRKSENEAVQVHLRRQCP